MEKRPRVWKGDESLTITEDTYNMKYVHTYLIKLFRQEDSILFIQNLEKKSGVIGLFVADEDKILIERSLSEPEKIITLLHELFHVFFHDEDDTCGENPELVERRAENSALNLLQWYKKHPIQYKNFLKEFKKIRRGKR